MSAAVHAQGDATSPWHPLEQDREGWLGFQNITWRRSRHTELRTRTSHTGARDDKGADVPAVPAVGEHDTFTEERTPGAGVKGGGGV